ncbi:MAG: DUF488 domain-containing protein [Candidatus Poribacteria bacterium]|nr:DUF488 domain-containing protein [Candidatus Poribacteria bacterium]
MERSLNPIPIYTIGYGNRSIREFIEVLHQHEIAYLIDVRSAPYSRYKPEFTKAQLTNELEQHGIHYVFMGDTLGGRPDDETCYVNGKLDYERVKEREYYHRGIERLHTAFSQQHSVVLMCSEGKPEECHRCKLIGATLITQDIPVIHIDENGEQVTQEKVIERLTGVITPQIMIDSSIFFKKLHF